ncbi:MAG: hypothetical protein QOH53_1890 [Ilumatobacteraceae bacterium]
MIEDNAVTDNAADAHFGDSVPILCIKRPRVSSVPVIVVAASVSSGHYEPGACTCVKIGGSGC